MTVEQDPATLVLGLRIWIGITQEAFGRMLGVSRGRISQWETGADAPPTGMMIAMGNMCPDSKGQVSRPDTPRAMDFFRLAGVYRAKSDLLDRAVRRIREFIRRVSPDKDQIVELQSHGRGVEEQLERALEMLEKLVPDIKQSSEIPGMTEGEAEFFKQLYDRSKMPGTGRKKG